MISPRPKQSLAEDLRDDLFRFIQQKFYPDSLLQQYGDEAVNRAIAVDRHAWAVDRDRLLKWVILWPAKFMTGKGFTLPGERYKKIFSDIILDAVRFGNTSKVKYRPAWLKHVIQEHFKHHWEEYYAEAKSARAQADHALHVLGKLKIVPDADPVKDLSAAAALLARTKPAKKTRPLKSANLEFNL